MKIIVVLLAALAVTFTGSSQSILNRFTDPDIGQTVFIEKGHHAFGISGSYRSLSAVGDAPTISAIPSWDC